LETSKPNLIFRGLEIDEIHKVIIKDNREIGLTNTEFEVLLIEAWAPFGEGRGEAPLTTL
jgi:hypothetical protein